MDNKLTCLAVDDDPTSLMIITNLVKKDERLSLLETYTDPIEAAAGIILHKPSIIFLDVEMPEFTGLEMVESLVRPPKVIMITSKKDYKEKAFDLEVTDFLIKPVMKERFAQAMEKTIESIRKDNLTIKVDE
ncbi:MAG: response regulator [Cyclobacteriaceae bacterium]